MFLKLADSTPLRTGARQDTLLMWYNIIHGKLTAVDCEITACCIDIHNRADPDLYQFVQYSVNTCDPTLGESYALAKQFGQQLIESFCEVVNSAPLYKDGRLIPASYLLTSQ